MTSRAVFGGTPQCYLRIAWLMGFGSHAYLYACMLAVIYGWRGESWIFGAQAIGVTCVSAILLSLFSYRTMMQLDARYGSGARWKLTAREVRLPEEV